MWIEHDGKGAPDLPPGTLVQVRFGDGIGENWSPEPWEYWATGVEGPDDHWTHDDRLGPSEWIISYRVVTNEIFTPPVRRAPLRAKSDRRYIGDLFPFVVRTQR